VEHLPRNLTNWPAEFGEICRRKLWSLPVSDHTLCVTLTGC